MLKAFLVASTLIFVASASVWPRLEGPLLMPHAIRINICPNYNATCIMKRGTTFHAELDFLASKIRFKTLVFGKFSTTEF